MLEGSSGLADRPRGALRCSVWNGVEPASGEIAVFGFRFGTRSGTWGQVGSHHWASLQCEAGAAFGFGGSVLESDDTVNGAYPLNQEGI